MSVAGFSQCASDILLCFVRSHIYHNCISPNGTPELFWGVSVELHWEVGNRYTWINMSLLICGSLFFFFLIAWFWFCFLLISGGSLWVEPLKCFYFPLFGSYESTPGKHKISFFGSQGYFWKAQNLTLLDETRQDYVFQEATKYVWYVDVRTVRLRIQTAVIILKCVCCMDARFSAKTFAVQICFYCTALFADAAIASGDEGF